LESKVAGLAQAKAALRRFSLDELGRIPELDIHKYRTGSGSDRTNLTAETEAHIYNSLNSNHDTGHYRSRFCICAALAEEGMLSSSDTSYPETT